MKLYKPSEEIETTASSKNDAKCLKLSLTKERSRFLDPPVSDDKMIEFAKWKKCVNTDRTTNWAIGVFKEWMKPIPFGCQCRFSILNSLIFDSNFSCFVDCL